MEKRRAKPKRQINQRQWEDSEPEPLVEEPSSVGALDSLAGYHLRRASNLFALIFSRAVAGTGMRQVLFGILSVVSANPGITQGSVGRRLGIQRANMVALVNELVELKYIERKNSSDDRRAFKLSITPEGQDVFEKCLMRIRRLEKKVLAGASLKADDLLIAVLRGFSDDTA